MGLVIALPGAGCGDPATYNLHVTFPDAQAKESTTEVVIWALNAEEFTCKQLEKGDVDPDDPGQATYYSRLVVEFPDPTPASLSRVPSGAVLFFAEGRTSSGGRILRGCTRENVEAGASKEVTVRLEWICHPNPDGEILDNRKDDDCDGLTDECASDEDCDDGRSCTADFCLHNLCENTPFPDDTVVNCNDGDPCTTGDRCQSGECVGQPRDCSVFAGPCEDGVCDHQTGECGLVPRPEGSDCQDGLYCTENETCRGGGCTGEPRDCSDGDECTRDACNEGLGRCDHVLEPRPGLEGPMGDQTCSNGADDDCDGRTDGDDPGCAPCASNDQCDDGNECTADSCTAGQCLNDPVADGTPCSDGLYCTVDDGCSQGICRGDPRECPSSGEVCYQAVCLEEEERCDDLPRPDGAACDDGQYCTVGDSCAQGVCAGSLRDCGDDDICTRDTCDEGSDLCRHDFEPRPGEEGPPGDPTCSNDVDDDCDGATDRGDLDCGCVPDCAGIECGPDPICAEPCGTCGEGEVCSVDGRCVPGATVPVPEGPFMMGCNQAVDSECAANEHPYHQVHMDAFEIDTYEVTQAAYGLCMAAGVCTTPPCGWAPEVRADHPVVCVDWSMAATFCAWVGKRLCSEAEWEKAARGTDGRKYPWGDQAASCTYAVMDDGGKGCGSGTTQPVGSRPDGRSPFGAFDMAGNVAEWVMDWYSASYYDECTSACSNPQGPDGGSVRARRGGSYDNGGADLRVSFRYQYGSSSDTFYVLGFRCCR